ncbi:hypothetical protein COXBURSA334_1955 [Coxiella burnetii Q321]|nr:hypothetical protein COXBURSA334_1955 [Coxiella burnetii Q321]
MRQRQERWGFQRGAMQYSPLVAVSAGSPRRRNSKWEKSRSLMAETLAAERFLKINQLRHYSAP